LTEEVVEDDAYDSDKDPAFIPLPIYETDRDFDEYSDGEIKVSCSLPLKTCLEN
jgi:hypothetical protein